MRQIVNVKKVTIDSDKKVSVVVEFLAGDRISKENVFSLIEMQGDVVEASFSASQMELPMRETAHELAEVA